MKKILKLKSLFIALILLLAFSCFANAATLKNYDANETLKYAKAHCNDSTEPGATKQDCIEFARTCVQKGGIPKDSSRVFKDGTGYTVKAYMDYLTDNGYAKLNKLKTRTVYTTDGSGRSFDYVHQDDNVGLVAPGDIIIYKCNNKDCKKGYFHATICAEPDNNKHEGFYRYYGHNPSAEYKVLCTINCYSCKNKNGLELYALHITPNGSDDASDTEINAKAVRSAYNKLKVSWNAIDGATGYLIFHKPSNNVVWEKIDEVNGTSYTYTVPKEFYGATQYFKVTPYEDVDGSRITGKESDPVSAYTVPSAPSKVTVTQTGDRNFKVSWPKVSGATAYKVEYRPLDSSKWSFLYRGSNLSATRKGLAANKKYTFKVTTYTSSENYKGERGGKYKTCDVYTFKKIGTPTVKRVNSKTVKVSWKGVSKATGYQISQSTSKSKDGTIKTIKSSSAKSAKITAKKGKSYYYKVRAYKVVKGKKVYGCWSTAKKY